MGNEERSLWDSFESIWDCGWLRNTAPGGGLSCYNPMIDSLPLSILRKSYRCRISQASTIGRVLSTLPGGKNPVKMTWHDQTSAARKLT